MTKTNTQTNATQLTILDENEKRILISILVQQYQPITISDILNRASNEGYLLEKEETKLFVENLKRRDLVSVTYISQDNTQVTAFGMAKPAFKNIPENAMIKDILPSFIQSTQAKKFLKQLDTQSSDTKKGRELGYRNYANVEIVLENIIPIVGGSLNRPKKVSPQISHKIEDIEKKAKKKDKEDGEDMQVAYLPRNYNGDVAFEPNHIRQYFIDLFRPYGVADSGCNQIYFPVQEPVQASSFVIEQWPVIIRGQGRGIKSAEGLAPGSKIFIQFKFPFTGTKITNATDLKMVIEQQAPFTGFGCHPNRYGRCKLVDFKVTPLIKLSKSSENIDGE